MTTKTDEARTIASKLLNLEIDRKSIVDEQKSLKEQLMTLIDEGADSNYDFPQGLVFLSNTESFSVPDGLLAELDTKVKNPEKLSQELIDKYFNKKLAPTRRALKELRNSENPDLSSIVVQEEKQSIKIKL